MKHHQRLFAFEACRDLVTSAAIAMDARDPGASGDRFLDPRQEGRDPGGWAAQRDEFEPPPSAMDIAMEIGLGAAGETAIEGESDSRPRGSVHRETKGLFAVRWIPEAVLCGDTSAGAPRRPFCRRKPPSAGIPSTGARGSQGSGHAP